MMSADELLRFAAPLAYRVADKFFKFTSWAIIVVGLRYANSVSNSRALSWLAWIATDLFSTALILQALYIAVRDPEGLGVPPAARTASRVIQFVVAVTIGMFLTSPALYLDELLEALKATRPK